MAKPTPSGEGPGGRDATGLRQSAVYRQYLELQSIAAERFSGALAGRLLLCAAGFDLRGAELALATTLAGGAFLGIDPDPERLKTAVRNGSCDFMVNTLDEALRVLKNELRKHAPLSTGLLGDPADILPAMVARGVQPDLIAPAPDEGYRRSLDTLSERGAHILTPPNTETPAPEEVSWSAATPRDMRHLDRIALDLLPPEDTVRRRWLEQAPGIFHRQKPLERILDLHPAERARFLDQIHAAPLESAATLRWKDLSGVEQSVEL